MKTNQLSAREVSSKKKPGYYCDGGGLYLRVSKRGDRVSRSWVFRFSSPIMRDDAGKSKIRDMGLGPLETVSLAEARNEAKARRKDGHCQSKILNTWSGHRTAQIDPEKCSKINGREIRF